MSDEYIKREDVIQTIAEVDDYGDGMCFEVKSHAMRDVALIPSADVVEREKYELDKACAFSMGIEASRKRGEWVEKQVVDIKDTPIEEWQSARCSVCGKYHTTPYMYYFDNYKFCPNCGASMERSE